MIQELINAFNNSINTEFVAFEYTNRFGETASRLIQLNTSYENALKSDINPLNTKAIQNIEYVQNDKYDKATFIIAQAELMKSKKTSLGIDDGTSSKSEKDMHKNRSDGQKNAYVEIAKNIKYNVEKQQLMIFAKEVRKNVTVEGEYPTVKKRAKTLAKDFIKKELKSSKFRNYIITNIDNITMNGDTIEIN